MSFLFYGYVFMSMQPFCYYLQSWHTDPYLFLLLHNSVPLSQVPTADSYWNVTFFRNPLLQFYKPWSDHVTAAEFVGKDGRHRLLTQMPWMPIDNFYFCSPNLSRCYLSCGKLQLLQPPSPPPSSEQRCFCSDFAYSAAMCKVECQSGCTATRSSPGILGAASIT